MLVVAVSASVWLMASPRERSHGYRSDEISFVTVAQGRFGRIGFGPIPPANNRSNSDEAGNFHYTLRDMTELQAFLRANADETQTFDGSSIDFEKFMLVSIVLGPSGGATSINVGPVRSGIGQITVLGQVRPLCEVSITVITTPYVIIQIPRSSATVDVALTTLPC